MKKLENIYYNDKIKLLIVYIGLLPCKGKTGFENQGDENLLYEGVFLFTESGFFIGI